MRAILLGLLLLAAAGPTRADGADHGYRFTVAPQPARENESILVTIETLEQKCEPLPAAVGLEDLGGGLMRVRIFGGDECTPNPPMTRSYNVGTLPAGRYVFRFAICGFLPSIPGADDCTPSLEDVPVRVQGIAATPHTIPSASPLGLACLALLAAACAAFALRR